MLCFLVIRSEKEKSKFQAEVYELLAQVENSTKEKILISKTVEKLEVTISELHIKIEELNRTIVDITSHKQRLSQENVELIKEVQDLKVIYFVNTYQALVNLESFTCLRRFYSYFLLRLCFNNNITFSLY